MMRSISRPSFGMRVLCVSFAALLVAAPMLAEAEDAPAAPPSPAAAAPEPTPTPAAATPPAPAPAAATAPAISTASFNQEELRKLLAPIALYPDPLLAQILPASAYPLLIVQLQRWIEQHPQAVAKNDFSEVDKTNWDPAVKALARFPTVVKTMSEHLQWTTDSRRRFRQSTSGRDQHYPNAPCRGAEGGQLEELAAADGRHGFAGRAKLYIDRTRAAWHDLCPHLRYSASLSTLLRRGAVVGFRRRHLGRRDLGQQLVELGWGICE